MKTRITSLGTGALSSVSARVGSSFLCPCTTPNLPYLCKHINTGCLLTLWCISLLSPVLTLMLHNNSGSVFLDSSLGPPSLSQLFTGSCLSYPLTKSAPGCSPPAKAERLPNSFLLKDLCILSVPRAITLQLQCFSQVIFLIVLNSHGLALVMQPHVFPKLPKTSSCFQHSAIRQALISS